MAPTAYPVLVGFGQKVIDGVYAFRIDLAQWRLGKVVAGIEKGERGGASVFGGGRPAELLTVIAIQRGPATGVARVQGKYSMLTATNSLGLLVS
jgi:hypothetical protein